MQQVQGIFSLYSNGHFNEALDAANALLQEHRDEGILLNLLGLIHAALLQYEQAIDSNRSCRIYSRGRKRWATR